MSKLAALAGLFAIGLLVALGLYLFWKGARNVQHAIASTAWPTTKGVITGSESSENTSRDKKTGAVSTIYSTETRIRFYVDTKEYSTDLIHFGQTLGSGSASEAALQRIRYPAGAEVNVSYNPGDPSIAVLKPGLHSEAFWLPGAGLAFLAPAIMCLVIFPTMYRSLTEVDKPPTWYTEAVRQAKEGGQQGVTQTIDLPPGFAGGGDSSFAIVAGIFGGIFCAGGTLMLVSGLLRMWHGYASQSWPTTQGEVVFAKVTVSERGRNDESSEGADQGHSQTYSPQFVYQYEVGGVTHYNNMRRFGRVEGEGEDWARNIARRYPKGAKVSVSYFPADPDVATLETGNDSEALYLPGIGLVVLLFSLAVFIFIVPSIAKFP